MKLKRILIGSIISIMFSIFFIAQNITYATTTQSQLHLGITALMSGDQVKINSRNEKGYLGYAIGNPKTANTPDTINAAVIWNIVEYDSSNSNENNYSSDKSIFCLKSGVGFKKTGDRQTYNKYFDMKTEKDTIKSEVTALSDVIDSNVTVDDEEVNRYDAILAMLDMFYIKGTETDRKALLQEAGIDLEDYEEEGILNGDDIKAVQQAALWYFTNSENTDDVFDNTQKDENWLYYTTDGNTYEAFSSFDPDEDGNANNGIRSTKK